MQLKKKKKGTENGHAILSKGTMCIGINYSNGPIKYLFNTGHLI